MGIYVIRMPDIGEGIAEVELVAWHVQPGDVVAEDQPIADVMTDKATVEIPAHVPGKVLSVGGAVGRVLAVGAELVRLEVEGEGNLKEGASSLPLPLGEGGGEGRPAVGTQVDKAAEASPHPAPLPEEEGVNQGQKTAQADAHQARAATHSIAQPTRTAIARAPGERPLASPAVRRLAQDRGIDLRYVHGSGPAGQIRHEDLEAYAASGGQPKAQGSSQYVQRHGEEQIPVIGLRRRIAQKMQEAKRRIPHFSYVEEIDVTELEQLRQRLNQLHGATRGKLTLLPFLARAMVLALRDFPQINARYDDEAGTVTRYEAVHLGIATQTDAGLMVPVLRHAESLDLWQCAAAIARVAEGARTGKAAREELSDSTITLTSLGPLGGIASTPVINHPEVAIVGVNRMVQRPMFASNGQVVARQLMNLSSSFDHRVVDGMDAARFIQAMRALLETPALLFVE
ncbi:branched-chain alpha-keto acid dehydrogenase subunit E2 [Melaminivora suipulveris]|uniref:Dihydrolipoamide acetyltransferase component of pyruvate dehydrogenase complex n=1 Tax=Melaminivora suipulveris TaxID=2109913 RepID=A0A2R3QAN8_9BURK|nr:dihydrolipoamide acetyltransferase family protein [Melaminivora suipulveris]AVO48853.1 branched-chain alpha-keto acid dehydrogenase subunit E2 [Melaminivora suipulveris]